MDWRRLFSEENRRAYLACIGEISNAEEVQRLRRYPHHRTVSRYEHSLLVSYLSFVLARRWGMDAYAAARAGLLHDLFWMKGEGGIKLCIRHPEEAAANAGALLKDLTDKERNIILSHMWPAGRHLPKSREAWLVDAVDDYVALLDFTNRSLPWSRQIAALVAA